MRISDWSSDVCSSDLLLCASGGAAGSLPGVDQALVESDAMPPKLSAFGLFRSNDPKAPTTGIGYTLRAPLFSDYTDKHRFVAIPAGKKAKVAADGTIEFPEIGRAHV